MQEDNQPAEESDSLENLEKETNSTPQHLDNPESIKPKNSSGISGRIRSIINKLNVYLLTFILILVVASLIVFVSYQSSKNPAVTKTQTQELTQKTIDALMNSDASVGDPKQLLTVESNSLFTGKVLIRGGLDVAGSIKVGGPLSLPGITVSGASTFDKVSLNSLDTSGDVNINGQLSVGKGLTVTGPVAFAGTFSATTFSIDTLQINQDIQINRHIDAGGPTPNITAGNAIGSNGTVTISGTDTSGTVTINVGSNPVSGVLATITFKSAFKDIPHVVITPIAKLGASIVTGTQKFYLSSRTSSNFSIATSGALTTGSVSFDYVTID